MKNNGNSINDPLRLAGALRRRGIILGASESFLAGLFFYLGFLLAGLGGFSRTYMPSSELISMSLGAAFSYAFIFVFRKSHQTNCGSFSRKTVTELFSNISYAYLLHLAILFLFKDSGFSSVRSAIGLAYLLGFMAMVINRFALSRIPGFEPVREGKKTLIIKGMKNKVREVSESENRIPGILSNRRGIRVSQSKQADDVQTEDAHAAR
jgi:hypothetical protein